MANSRASVVSAHVVSLAFTSSRSSGAKWAEAVTVDGLTTVRRWPGRVTETTQRVFISVPGTADDALRYAPVHNQRESLLNIVLETEG